MIHEPVTIIVENNNPLSLFSHFEIQSMLRHLPEDGSGETFEEPFFDAFDDTEETEFIDGPPFYTLFGRLDPDKIEDPNMGGLIEIRDCETVEEAQQLIVYLCGA